MTFLRLKSDKKHNKSNDILSLDTMADQVRYDYIMYTRTVFKSLFILFYMLQTALFLTCLGMTSEYTGNKAQSDILSCWSTVLLLSLQAGILIGCSFLYFLDQKTSIDLMQKIPNKEQRKEIFIFIKNAFNLSINDDTSSHIVSLDESFIDILYKLSHHCHFRTRFYNKNVNDFLVAKTLVSSLYLPNINKDYRAMRTQNIKKYVIPAVVTAFAFELLASLSLSGKLNSVVSITISGFLLFFITMILVFFIASKRSNSKEIFRFSELDDCH